MDTYIVPIEFTVDADTPEAAAERVWQRLSKAGFDVHLPAADTIRNASAAARCPAVLYHGPGHQSKTRCRRGNVVHKVHEAVYGSRNQFAEWAGPEATTGYFDEPPEVE